MCSNLGNHKGVGGLNDPVQMTPPPWVNLLRITTYEKNYENTILFITKFIEYAVAKPN